MKDKCITPNCRNKKRKGSRICGKCKSRKYREQNPERSSFNNLKNNSKRRGIEFHLTFEEFHEFCVKTEYLLGKGKTKESFSIDRIDPNKGYILENLQVLTLSENSRKRKLLMYEYQTKYATVVTLLPPKPPEEGEDLF